MRKWKWNNTLLVFIAMLLVFSAGCSSEGGNNTKTEAPTTEGSEGGGENSIAEAPLGKYAQTVEVTTARGLPPSLKFMPGDSIDNNIWYRDYLEELNIKLVNEWSVPQAQLEQKMNVTIASGKIPDILAVSANELKRLIDADMVEDLSEVFEKYASETTKRVLTNDGGSGMQAATYEGRLLALPKVGFTGTGARMLWIRQDWLDKTGLAPPQSMEDVMRIAEAFSKDDPDGNGQQDTLGLGGIDKGTVSMKGFFESYHAYPGFWLKNDAGELVYGDVQPEVKLALEKLQEMFKSGLLDPEFAVKDTAKAYELIAANKVGMFYGGEGAVWWPLTDHYKKDKVDWRPYMLVSHDGQPAKTAGAVPINGYFVVRKGFANPEALVKLMNFGIEKQYGPEGRLEKYWYAGENNEIAVSSYAAVIANDPLELIDIHRGVQASFDAGQYVDSPIADVKRHYELSQKFLDGTFSDIKDEGEAWSSYKWAGQGSGMNMVSNYVRDGLYLIDEYSGPSTPTMTAKKSTLDKMRDEVFTKIIMGQAEVDTFDRFVDDWKKLGGNDITREVNEWYEAKQQ
ncbi:extracellular solute-binding protein [Paenibacillaceae bacterium]|nr:extracellular solute-binding protein [Paenibacillaceae bacterium]